MPRARDKAATAVNIGVFTIMRRPYRRSEGRFCMAVFSRCRVE
jgi:hypothetical protein